MGIGRHDAHGLERHGKQLAQQCKIFSGPHALIDAATQPGERRPVALNSFLDEYVNLSYHGFRARVADFEVQLERDFDKAVGEVEMVPQEIGRVVISLLDNAYYAVDEERKRTGDSYVPRVWVSTRKEADRVVVRVLVVWLLTY